MTVPLSTLAVVLEEPERLALTRLALDPPGDGDVLVDVEWSGISTGTERLLWSGRMPPFPGMGYPLVPGYETVGRVREAGTGSGRKAGDYVFVPGARCYGKVRGLFGGAASSLVAPGARVLPVDAALGERAVLLALAATALHAIARSRPELVVGHGVLGRLIARAVIAQGGAAPTVWERNATRTAGALGYPVLSPDDDPRRDYRVICDASGDAGLLDALIARLAPQGEVVLAGFYSEPLAFAFPPAFMREARLSIAAQWQQADLEAARALAESGALSLDDLVTHREDAARAAAAYRTAFAQPDCLKMILDWRSTR